jgi:hypothetical protein
LVGPKRSQPIGSTSELQEDDASHFPEITAGKLPARRLFRSEWLRSAGLQPGIFATCCRKQQSH